MEQVKKLFSNFIPIDFFKKFTIKSFLTLEGATILYLALPYLIFFAGWLNIFLAIPVCGLLIFSVLSYGLDIKEKPLEKLKSSWNSWNLPKKIVKINWLIIIFVLVLAWVLLSGAGAYFYQNDDYIKHNSVMRALIENPYPAHYDFEEFFHNAYEHYNFGNELSEIENHNNSFTIVFYIAYYLPAAIAGKLFGWGGAMFAILIWTVIAVFLAVLWFMRFIKHFSPLAVLFFILFSGMDIIGQFLISDEVLNGTLHLEWYTGLDLFQYSSNTSSLYWVPQHLLSSWLTTSLIFYNGEVKKSTKHIAFITALAVFWSPFVFIGLFPYALYCVIKNDKNEIFTIHNVVTAPIIAGIITLFIMSNTSDIPKGFIWEMVNMHDRWMDVFIFILLEFGIYALLIKGHTKSVWKTIAIICLLVIPIYKMGRNNDFVMRVSLPSLYILVIYIGKFLFDKKNGFSGAKKILLVLLILSSTTSFTEISRTLERRVNGPKKIEQTVFISAVFLSYQYIGTTDAFFFNTLSSYRHKPIQEDDYIPLFEGISFVNSRKKEENDVGGDVYLLFRSVGETTKEEMIFLTLKHSETGEVLFTQQVEFDTPCTDWETGNYTIERVHYNLNTAKFKAYLQVFSGNEPNREIPLDLYFERLP